MGSNWDWSECQESIARLQAADTSSAEAFRYAVARDGVTPLPATSIGKVDIPWLSSRLNDVLEALEGWESALEAQRDAIRESRELD